MSDYMFKTAAEKEAAVQDLFLKTAAVSGIDLDQVDDQSAVSLYQAFDYYEKTAAQQGVNLWSYPLEGIATGFDQFLSKIAGSDEEEKKKEEEKKEEEKKAAAYYLSKIAAEQQTAEQFVQDAEMFGKIAAHSYVAQVKKLANDPAAVAAEAVDPGFLQRAGQVAREYGPTAAGVAAGLTAAGTGAYALHRYLQNRRAAAAAATPVAAAPEAMPMAMDPAAAAGMPDGGVMKAAADFKPKSPPPPSSYQKARDAVSGALYNAKVDPVGAARSVGKGALVLGATGAAIYGGKKGIDAIKKYIHDKRQGPPPEQGGAEKAAFDRLAADAAFDFLVENGIHPKVASDRLVEALQKDIGNPSTDNVKMAAIQDPNLALSTRAGELLTLADFEF